MKPMILNFVEMLRFLSQAIAEIKDPRQTSNATCYSIKDNETNAQRNIFDVAITILHLVNLSYQQIRSQQGTRKGFFQDILSLPKYLLFNSWQHLIDFMLFDSAFSFTINSS